MNLINIHTTLSTNDTLKKLIRTEPLENFTTLRANFQTNGKGQQGNTWVSEPSKNLLFSIYVQHQELKIIDGFKLNKQVSLALVFILKKYTDNVMIKWPNDILAGNKKIAGVLIENIVKGSNIKHSVIGIGLNINQTDFGNLSNKATSLKLITKQSYDLELILIEIIDQLKYFINLNSIEMLHNLYLSNLYGYQTFKNYQTIKGYKFKGKITGITKIGELEIENLNEKKYSFDKKQIILLYD